MAAVARRGPRGGLAAAARGGGCHHGGVSSPLDDPFAPGARLRLARGRGDELGPFRLRGGDPNRDVGRLELDRVATAALLVVGEREWRIEPWGRRGWKLAAVGADGGHAAWWEHRGRLRGSRLVVAPEHELTLRHAFGRRPARVLDEAGGELLRVDVLGRGERAQALLDVCTAPPPGVDPQLLAGFAAAVLLLYRMFSPPQRAEHPWVPGGVFGDLGGGGGGGDGGG